MKVQRFPMTENHKIRQGIYNTVLLQIKFAMTSSIATLVDYTLYLVLVNLFLGPVLSNIISYGTGMLINFLLQRKFIFLLNRKVISAFALSMSFSVIGLVLSTTLIYLLTQIAFFSEYQFITKLLVTGIIFFYNFFTKRYAFEKKSMLRIFRQD